MRKSQLSKAKQDRPIGCFVTGAKARCAADLVSMNPKTVIYYFHRLREIIAYHLEQEADTVFSWKIEVDKSYFGGKRKRKRGRGAAGKVLVPRLLKRGGKVYTKVIADASSATLYPIIERKVVPTVSSIQTAGEIITCWMYLNSSISVSIILNFLQTRKTISTGPKFLVVIARQGMFTYPIGKPRAICASLMVFRKSILGYFQRNVSGVLTTLNRN